MRMFVVMIAICVAILGLTLAPCGAQQAMPNPTVDKEMELLLTQRALLQERWSRLQLEAAETQRNAAAVEEKIKAKEAADKAKEEKKAK